MRTIIINDQWLLLLLLVWQLIIIIIENDWRPMCVWQWEETDGQWPDDWPNYY